MKYKYNNKVKLCSHILKINNLKKIKQFNNNNLFNHQLINKIIQKLNKQNPIKIKVKKKKNKNKRLKNQSSKMMMMMNGSLLKSNKKNKKIKMMEMMNIQIIIINKRVEDY